MKVDLSSKAAVITGGGGLLCGYFAKALASSGARVAILDLSEDAAQKVAGEITDEGGKAIGVQCDALKPESVQLAEKIVYEKFGQYHILINGVGGAPRIGCTSQEVLRMEDINLSASEENTLFNLIPDNIRAVVDINFMGSFIPTQVFARRMAGVAGATIINISSMSALSPLTKQIAYSASKAAVTNFTKWLATYLADAGIRVNAIAPGFFVTNINRHLLFNADGSYNERSAKIVAGTPMARFGDPSELIGTMLYLCDNEASSFVTGAVVPVDGGFSSYCGV